MSTRSERKRRARRRVLPGFPVERPPFDSPQEVYDYLNGVGEYEAPDGRIVCLLCGKNYRALGAHLSRIHEVDVDEYRKRYGLPWTVGVASPDCRERYGAATRDRIDNGWKPGVDADEMAERVTSAPHRPRAPYRKHMACGPLPEQVKISDEVWDEFLRRVASGRTPGEVLKDSDMPVYSCLHSKRGSDPGFAARYDEVLDELPFSVQARCESLGDRFKEAARALRDQGKFYREIADQLGVTTMTVFRHLDERQSPTSVNTKSEH